jgi:hypothetical protein
MIRTIVQLTDEQWVDAREQARLEGLSLAAFVRHAIDTRLARAESARSAVKRRALAAIDGLELHDRGQAGDSDGRGNGQDDQGRSNADDPGEGRAVPRYWLEQ